MAGKNNYLSVSLPIVSYRRLIGMTSSYPIATNQLLGSFILYALDEEECWNDITRFAEKYQPKGDSSNRGVIHLPQQYAKAYNALRDLSLHKAIAFNYGVACCLTESKNWQRWHKAAIKTFADEALSLVV